RVFAALGRIPGGEVHHVTAVGLVAVDQAAQSFGVSGSARLAIERVFVVSVIPDVVFDLLARVFTTEQDALLLLLPSRRLQPAKFDARSLALQIAKIAVRERQSVIDHRDDSDFFVPDAAAQAGIGPPAGFGWLYYFGMHSAIRNRKRNPKTSFVYIEQ